jgi:membrane protein implicated in regulation of membrane protease activity
VAGWGGRGRRTLAPQGDRAVHPGAVLLLGIKAFTVAFFAAFVAVGLLAAALGTPLCAQLATLSAVCSGGLAVARPPLARAMMRSRTPMLLSGVKDFIGQTAPSVDEVGDEHHPGHALLAGGRWLAIAENGLPLPSQSAVTVAAVRGTTLVVRARAALPRGDPVREPEETP